MIRCKWNIQLQIRARFLKSLVSRSHCLLSVSAALWILIELPPNDTEVSLKRIRLLHSVELCLELPRGASLKKREEELSDSLYQFFQKQLHIGWCARTARRCCFCFPINRAGTQFSSLALRKMIQFGENEGSPASVHEASQCAVLHPRASVKAGKQPQECCLGKEMKHCLGLDELKITLLAIKVGPWDV